MPLTTKATACGKETQTNTHTNTKKDMKKEKIETGADTFLSQKSKLSDLLNVSDSQSALLLMVTEIIEMLPRRQFHTV